MEKFNEYICVASVTSLHCTVCRLQKCPNYDVGGAIYYMIRYSTHDHYFGQGPVWTN